MPRLARPPSTLPQPQDGSFKYQQCAGYTHKATLRMYCSKAAMLKLQQRRKTPSHSTAAANHWPQAMPQLAWESSWPMQPQDGSPAFDRQQDLQHALSKKQPFTCFAQSCHAAIARSGKTPSTCTATAPHWSQSMRQPSSLSQPQDGSLVSE